MRTWILHQSWHWMRQVLHAHHLSAEIFFSIPKNPVESFTFTFTCTCYVALQHMHVCNFAFTWMSQTLAMLGMIRYPCPKLYPKWEVLIHIQGTMKTVMMRQVFKIGDHEAAVWKIGLLVLNMCRPLFRKCGYTVSMDNSYTSVTAVLHLKNHGNLCRGPVNQIWCLLLKSVLFTKAESCKATRGGHHFAVNE